MGVRCFLLKGWKIQFLGQQALVLGLAVQLMGCLKALLKKAGSPRALLKKSKRGRAAKKGKRVRALGPLILSSLWAVGPLVLLTRWVVEKGQSARALGLRALT